MLNKFTIYGERCSGTTYLEQIINLNFKADITWEYGWKHFFGFHDLTNSDDTLFICIVRNPYDWINSFYKYQYHLPIQFKNKFNFLNNEFYSINKNLKPKFKYNSLITLIKKNLEKTTAPGIFSHRQASSTLSGTLRYFAHLHQRIQSLIKRLLQLLLSPCKTVTRTTTTTTFL